MKGMSSRTTYFHNGEHFDETMKKDMVQVIGDAVLVTDVRGNTIEVKNGNRIATARIIRPKPVEVVEMSYRVTGWDKQMNTVRKISASMEEALDVATGLLRAKIKPVRR